MGHAISKLAYFHAFSMEEAKFAPSGQSHTNRK